MATIDDELTHLTLLHRLELGIVAYNNDINRISSQRHNPCSKLFLDKIIEKLSATYPVETSEIINNTDIFLGLNKPGYSGTDLTFHDCFMEFILKSKLNITSAFSIAFLTLAILGFK